jgi:fucose permease
MTNIRKANPIVSSGVNTGYWAGMTVGRLFLGFVTGRIGEWNATMIYLGLAAGLELIFWLVPNLYVSAVAVAFLGLVMGPMFPTSIVLVTKLLPKDLHVGTIGFATALGGSGGAVFPFIVGAVAQASGVRMLQPVVLGLLGAISLLWLVIPRKPQRDHASE